MVPKSKKFKAGRRNIKSFIDAEYHFGDTFRFSSLEELRL
jgi:hypothetical protein